MSILYKLTELGINPDKKIAKEIKILADRYLRGHLIDSDRYQIIMKEVTRIMEESNE